MPEEILLARLITLLLSKALHSRWLTINLPRAPFVCDSMFYYVINFKGGVWIS